MFLRLFFLFRTIANYSSYADAYSKSLCKKYGFTSSVRFAIKCNFVMHPERAFISTFLFSVMVLAYITRIFELPYFIEVNSEFGKSSSLANAMWLVIMTITTVGYGDVTPHTTPGKLLAICGALWGAFLISINVVTVAQIF